MSDTWQDSMLHDPIQGHGHGGPKVAIMANFKVYRLRQYAYIKWLTVNSEL